MPLPEVAPLPPGGVLIGEVAALLGISIDTVRYYERTGLTLSPPKRGSDGWRRYGERDVAWLAGLVMLRGTGMSIAQMREFAAVYRASGGERERLRLLEEHREIALARLEETRRHLVALDVKIAAYRHALDDEPR